MPTHKNNRCQVWGWTLYNPLGGTSRPRQAGRRSPSEPSASPRIKQCGNATLHPSLTRRKADGGSRRPGLHIYIGLLYLPRNAVHFLPFRHSGNCNILTQLWDKCFLREVHPPGSNTLHFPVKFYFAIITLLKNFSCHKM